MGQITKGHYPSGHNPRTKSWGGGGKIPGETKPQGDKPPMKADKIRGGGGPGRIIRPRGTITEGAKALKDMSHA